MLEVGACTSSRIGYIRYRRSGIFGNAFVEMPSPVSIIRLIFYFVNQLMSSKIFALFLCFCGAVGVSAQSSVNKVSINTHSQSEILYVNGTVRILSLPKDGATSGIYTRADGTVSTAADQPFQAKHEVVADGNGVLGRSSRTLPQFFYLPSIVMPTAPEAVQHLDYATYNAGTEIYTVNLYQVYDRQYGMLYQHSTKSPSATALPRLTGNNKFAYFITYYDKGVFTDVGVTNEGILTYKVNTITLKSARTYMNVVLKPISL